MLTLKLPDGSQRQVPPGTHPRPVAASIGKRLAPTAEARGLVEDLKQTYKVEHIDDDLHQYPSLSFYRQGEFIDLCRGPHIPHAGKVGAFKLLSIAGAYWKNDASRKQLQRLYGTA